MSDYLTTGKGKRRAMDALQLIREMFVEDHSWRGLDVAAVVNPFNKADYVHFSGFEHIDGQDDYKAWYGRGDAYKLRFYDEAGGSFSLCFGFHKGNMYAWVEKGPDAEDPPDETDWAVFPQDDNQDAPF